jgi:hypothetical protein
MHDNGTIPFDHIPIASGGSNKLHDDPGVFFQAASIVTLSRCDVYPLME